MEKLLGAPAESVLRIPGSKEDKAGWDGIYTKLGKPLTPGEYKIEAPKEGGDPQLAEWAKSAFHKANLSDEQAQALFGEWNGMTTAQKTAAAQAAEAKSAQEVNALKTEWGSNYDQNVKLVNQAASQLGIGNEQLLALKNAMGPMAAMKFMQGLGTKVGEPRFESSGPGANMPTGPEAAKAAIKMKTQDHGFMKKLMIERDSSARSEWDRLHQAAYPGENALG